MKYVVVDPVTGEEYDSYSPPFNLYDGRDTSGYALMFDGPDAVSRTQQEFLEETDINNIMARYIKTGTVPMYLDRGMLDGDMHSMSYHEMMNVIADANSAFASLPATVRDQFENDPAKFVDFALNEDNREKLREWNMLSPEAIERLDKAAADAAAAEAAKAAERTGAADKAAQGVSEPAK
ncbi:MAG: internal scaffolding protein [Microviridae sp.]|nr:MAG: internal scaffolding protein [Microviridae sp.]